MLRFQTKELPRRARMALHWASAVPHLGELVRKHHAIGQGSSDGDVHRHIIAINEVTSKLSENLSFPTSVIDWNAAEEVTAKVLPPQHNGLFSADKTYILFGLSGDVGISICNWMVNNGARHVVLASRKPNVPGFCNRTHVLQRRKCPCHGYRHQRQQLATSRL